MTVIPKFNFTAKKSYFKDQRRSWHKNPRGSLLRKKSFFNALYLYHNIASRKSQVVWNRMPIVFGYGISVSKHYSHFWEFWQHSFFIPSKIKSRNLSRSWWRILSQHSIGKTLRSAVRLLKWSWNPPCICTCSILN